MHTLARLMDTLDNIRFIYLDDLRIPPSTHWEVVRNAEDAYTLFHEAAADGHEIVLSLDHDLGEDIPTGYDLLNWIERDLAADPRFRPNVTFTVHSANPVGRMNMERAIRAIARRLL